MNFCDISRLAPNEEVSIFWGEYHAIQKYLGDKVLVVECKQSWSWRWRTIGKFSVKSIIQVGERDFPENPLCSLVREIKKLSK